MLSYILWLWWWETLGAIIYIMAMVVGDSRCYHIYYGYGGGRLSVLSYILWLWWWETLGAIIYIMAMVVGDSRCYHIYYGYGGGRLSVLSYILWLWWWETLGAIIYIMALVVGDSRCYHIYYGSGGGDSRCYHIYYGSGGGRLSVLSYILWLWWWETLGAIIYIMAMVVGDSRCYYMRLWWWETPLLFCLPLSLSPPSLSLSLHPPPPPPSLSLSRFPWLSHWDHECQCNSLSCFLAVPCQWREAHQFHSIHFLPSFLHPAPLSFNSVRPGAGARAPPSRFSLSSPSPSKPALNLCGSRTQLS